MAEIAVLGSELASLAKINFLGKKYTTFRTIWDPYWIWKLA